MNKKLTENVTMRKEKINALVTLNEQEILDRAKIASELNAEVTKMTNELKNIADNYKGTIKGKKIELDGVLTVIKTGKESQVVETDAYYDYVHDKITYHYRGEIVKERTMTEADRQEKFC